MIISTEMVQYFFSKTVEINPKILYNFSKNKGGYMILRKPYAFFIKHFKLIHIILAALVCYSIYRTKLLLDFFNEYSSTIINVQGQDLVTPLLPTLYQIVPIFIIMVSALVLVIMLVKKKPYIFYIITIAIAIFSLVILQVSKGVLTDLTDTLLDSRTIMLVRDLIMVSFLGQLFSIVIIVIRATGFDVKKFDFKTDLKDLEISEEDREEVEVQIKIDTNKNIRGIRRRIRFLKYAYKENKLIFNFVFTFMGVALVALITFSIMNKEKIITQNVYFNGNNFSVNLVDSYLVNTDYDGNVINSDYYYLLLRLDIKNNTTKNNSLDIATTKILIDNYVYTPTIEYRDSFFDFGPIYQSENIGSEYERKVLVYQIPKELINKDIIFSFVDKNITDEEGNFASTKIKVQYNDLTGISSFKQTTIRNELSFEDSILPDYKINISAYDIQDKYKLTYNFCIKDECYKSYEYLKPEITTNYDKTLLKIRGTLTKETNISGIYDLYDFIEKFGTLSYVIDGEEKYQTVKFKEVVSKKVLEENTYYIEVLDEVKDASSISFIFTIRDKNYKYILK